MTELNQGVYKVKYKKQIENIYSHHHLYCVSHRTSHTTRGPYYGEENGIDYHFVTEEEFQNLVHMVRQLSANLF